MCKKNKLRVYRELKEDFECKKYLDGCRVDGWELVYSHNGMNRNGTGVGGGGLSVHVVLTCS